MFSNTNGNASGPCCFTVPIGKLLQNCEKRSIENFTPVEVLTIVTNAKDISTDQKYLLDIHEAASSGQVLQYTGKRSPGS